MDNCVSTRTKFINTGSIIDKILSTHQTSTLFLKRRQETRRDTGRSELSSKAQKFILVLGVKSV